MLSIPNDHKLEFNDSDALQRLINFAQEEKIQISLDYYTYESVSDKWSVTAWTLEKPLMRSGKTLEDAIDKTIQDYKAKNKG